MTIAGAAATARAPHGLRARRVLAIVGSPVKRATWRAVQEFAAELSTRGPLDFEYVFLAETRLGLCRGCRACTVRGEEHCPCRDERDALVEKMAGVDGVILAAPNYSFHVPAIMKNYFDRLSYIFHRPRFFGKACTAIVVQGIAGGRSIRKYMEEMGKNWGFHASRGCCLRTLEPETDRQRHANAARIARAAARFSRELSLPAPRPSFFRLMLFRMGRTSIRTILGRESRDYRYYEDMGWFASDYYHPVKLGPVKKAAGGLFDFLGKRLSTQR
jgi:multimeric flavodoxin WrbA